MRLRWFAAIIFAGLLLGAGVVLGVLARPLPTVDVAELNDIRARLVQDWPAQDAVAAVYDALLPEDAPPLTVLNTAGTVLYQTAPGLGSELSTAQARAHVIPLRRDGEALGVLLVQVDDMQQIQAQLTEARAAVVAVSALLALLFGSVLWALWHYVLRPFQKL